MIINDETHYNLTGLILEYLQGQEEMKSLYLIAKAIKRSEAATKEELTRLVVLNRIRKGGTKSSPAYYIPSETQLAREKEGLKSNFKPLRPRTEHAAILERIRAEREAVPTLY
jgi:hypothetical protein